MTVTIQPADPNGHAMDADDLQWHQILKKTTERVRDSGWSDQTKARLRSGSQLNEVDA